MKQLSDYADVPAVAERLNIHPNSVTRLIRAGEIPAIKVFGKWLVDKGVLEQFASGYDPRPHAHRKSKPKLL